MAKQFQFDRVKDFIENFHIRDEGKTLYINGVKNKEDLLKKFKIYDVKKECKNIRVDDDSCGNLKLRFTRNEESFKYLLSFEEKYIKMNPIRKILKT